MNHNARRLTTLAALTLGIAIAAYSLGVLSDFRPQPAVNSHRVVDLGTILVTPEDASPPLARDGARYAMSGKRQRLNPRERSETSL